MRWVVARDRPAQNTLWSLEYEKDWVNSPEAFDLSPALSRTQLLHQDGASNRPVQSSSGITLMPDRTIFDPCPHFDTLIIPGGLGIFNVLEDDTVMNWIAKQGAECRRISAICNGVFALGAAGMINGKTVTTHWMDVPRLASMFKRAVIEPDRIFVKDGPIYTTAGVTAGIDLSLLFIEEDLGQKMALDVAKYLIVYLRRSGGQSQFSPLLESQAAKDSTLASVQDYVLSHPELKHSLESIAEHFKMSPRNLTRFFKKNVACRP